MNTGLADKRVLDVSDIGRYLGLLGEICEDSPVIDCHVHATEIIRNRVCYGASKGSLLSASDSAEYKKPKIANVRLDGGSEPVATAMQNKLSEMAFTRSYGHTGALVLGDQMRLARVDKAVLLPVASDHCTVKEQMDVIDGCCSGDDRFVPAFCISQEVPNEQIDENLAKAVQRYRVRAVKIHPNITGIDLSRQSGRTRVEEILRACDKHSLVVIIHGGCSPILGGVQASQFSIAKNLYEIDWSVSASPIIIAHFGVYGCGDSAPLASNEGQQLILRLLQQHSHLHTDTSGVSYAAIRQMLSMIEPGKVLFGSDAMYVPMYRQMAYVLHAVNEIGYDASDVKRIVSDNACRIFMPYESQSRSRR